MFGLKKRIKRLEETDASWRIKKLEREYCRDHHAKPPGFDVVMMEPSEFGKVKSTLGWECPTCGKTRSETQDGINDISDELRRWLAQHFRLVLTEDVEKEWDRLLEEWEAPAATAKKPTTRKRKK